MSCATYYCVLKHYSTIKYIIYIYAYTYFALAIIRRMQIKIRAMHSRANHFRSMRLRGHARVQFDGLAGDDVARNFLAIYLIP